MRRGSLTGPIILILIGGLFLLNNLRPDWSLLDMVSKYWPFLLIAWGTLRLLEILWTYQRKSLPSHRGVSGGEWALIIFICLAGSGLFFAREHFGARPWNRVGFHGLEFFGEAYDYPVEEQTTPTSKTVRVIVENFRGNVRITGSDAAEVKVTGRKTVRAMKQPDADEGNRRTPLEIVPGDNTVLIRTNQEKWRNEQFVTADLEISIPRGASLQARGRRGDFDVSDLDGLVEITSGNAGVRVQNLRGALRVDLDKSDVIRAVNVKGDVELKGHGENIELEGIDGQVVINGTYSGDLDFRKLAKSLRYEGPQTDLRVERCPGQIRMARGYFNGDDLVGPVVLTARSKDVQIAGFTQSLNLNLDRGEVDLRPGKLPLAKIEVVARSGHIELALPDGAKFTMRANVDKGEVQNDFGDVLRVDSQGRGGTISGSVGDGPAITLSTGRGSVTIRKSSGAELISPLTPMPPSPPKSPRDRAGVEEIIDRHRERVERIADEIGRRSEERADDLGRRIERELDKAERHLDGAVSGK